MTFRVGTLNEQKDLPDTVAAGDLRDWLTTARPDLAGLNEWTPDRNHILAALADYGWTRPSSGGPVALYRKARLQLTNCYPHELVGAQFVGNLDGRKSTLPPSIATVAKFTDLTNGTKVALVIAHLTAEVQNRFGDYHDDEAHRLRVRRHKKERRRLRRLVRKLRRRGYTVYVVGDTNYDRMPLPPLISCWYSNGELGTLGGRTVDYVYADREANNVRTFKGHSDHRGVIAIYPDQEAT